MSHIATSHDVSLVVSEHESEESLYSKSTQTFDDAETQRFEINSEDDNSDKENMTAEDDVTDYSTGK